MRAEKGDIIELFDGNGTLAAARIEQAGSKKAVCRIENLQKIAKPVKPQIVVASSIPKGERFDRLITECTELGADRIIPVIFERTVRQPKNLKTKERLQNQIIAAAKQCKRLFLPKLDSPVSLKESIENLKSDYADGKFIFGSCDYKSQVIADLDFGDKDIIVFIGPEGGMSGQEEDLLAKNGAVPVRLNENILRVETAAIAFVSILASRRMSKLS